LNRALIAGGAYLHGNKTKLIPWPKAILEDPQKAQRTKFAFRQITVNIEH